jgi:hypothetical protein
MFATNPSDRALPARLAHVPLLTLLLAGLLALSGCPETGQHDNNGTEEDVGEDVVSDVADIDAEDAAACSEVCDGETPVCDTESGTCVECLGDDDCDGVCDTETSTCTACMENADCEGNAGGEWCETGVDADLNDNACVACTDEGGCTGDTVCDAEGVTNNPNTCVTCLDTTQCTDADAAACDSSTGECTACSEDADCDSVAGLGSCVSGVCEECEDNDQCDDPTASVCGSDNTCTDCSGNDGCSHLDDTKVCDTSGSDGVCVECTIGEEDACTMSGECNPDTNECVSRETGSGTACEPCAADDECAPYHYCVPMQYTGGASAVDVGSYCLRLASAGCSRPFLSSLTATSVSGSSELQYCGLNSSLTTCSAWADTTASKACSGDAMCGDDGSTAGICRDIDLGGDKCTYECGATSQCPSGFSCDTGICKSN